MKKGLRPRSRTGMVQPGNLNQRPDEEGIKTPAVVLWLASRNLNQRPDEEGIKTLPGPS